MNRTPLLLLGLGLAAAAAAAVVLVSSTQRTARPAATANAARPRSASTGGAQVAAASGGGGATVSADAEVRVGDAWRRLRSDDLKTLMANLRAAGFPPEVIRAVVGALVHEQYAARRRQILGDQPPPPYWKTGSMASLYSSPQMAALRQLAREEQEAMRQLLGPDSATSELNQLYRQRMFGDLAPDKADALQRILSDYGELRTQIYADAGNGRAMLPSDREKLALLDQEQRDDIAALLTPEELRQYDLRSSPTAQRLRNQLTYFNPTEQEFLTLYTLQSQFDQQYNPPGGLLGMMSPDQMRQRQAAQQQLNDQIKAGLGDARYAEYQQATDPGFQTASRIASNLQLPAQSAVATWTLEQTTQQQAAAIRTDRNLGPDQRMAALAALSAQANQQLTQLLTQAGADQYRQTNGANWLRSLDMSARRPGRAGSAPSAPPASAAPSAPPSKP